jgi:transcription initiation factor TFIIE subunit alpha
MKSNKIIAEVVGELLGEDAVNIALYLKGKEKVSEFDVARDMKIDIHEARSILYKLYENNIAVFERRKDREKGWYITYWDFFPDNIMHIHRKIQIDKLDKLKERLRQEESSEYYMCRNACTRMDFERAIGFDFKCPECGELMNPMDNRRTIDFINERIREIEDQLAQSSS